MLKLFAYLLFFLLLFGQNATDSTSTQSQYNPAGGACIGLVLFLICYTRRTKEIGGWFLYFIIQLFIAVTISILSTTYAIATNRPSNFINIGYYALYLITVIPAMVILLCQGVIAIRMLPVSGREWKYVSFLIKVLWIDLAFSGLSLIIDAAIWQEAIPFDVLALIWPLIWLPYFKTSKRIRAIYQTKTWGLEILKQYVPETGESPK